MPDSWPVASGVEALLLDDEALDCYDGGGGMTNHRGIVRSGGGESNCKLLVDCFLFSVLC